MDCKCGAWVYIEIFKRMFNFKGSTKSQDKVSEKGFFEVMQKLITFMQKQNLGEGWCSDNWTPNNPNVDKCKESKEDEVKTTLKTTTETGESFCVDSKQNIW